MQVELFKKMSTYKNKDGEEKSLLISTSSVETNLFP